MYFHPYEVAGRAWPMVFSRIIVGLLIFQVTSAGIFALRRAFQQSALCAPLILSTIIFKVIMDAAYNHSSQVIPLQLLTQKFGSNHLQYANDIDHESSVQVEEQPPTQPTRRRTVLDEDDYEAEPTEYTDFREPPMTLFDGILNTGMKRFGHPAIVGVLPQLWLPVKGGHQLQRRQSRYIRPSISNISLRNKRSSSRVVSQPTVTSAATEEAPHNNVQTEYHDEPESMDAEETSGLLSNGDMTIQVDEEADDATPDTDYESEEDEGVNATYYHHPERRRSRTDALHAVDTNSAPPTSTPPTSTP